jgi:6-phosphogluconolactonase
MLREKLAMPIDVFEDEKKTAQAAAKAIAAEARAAVIARGRFVFAVSGGHTPWIMLGALADEELPWQSIHLVQVDERVAPAGHTDRNLTHLRESLVDHSAIPTDHIHAMRVEAKDLEAAASEYASLLSHIAGSPPKLDLVHLGLGPDGHTASLVPEDPVLTIADRDVAVTGMYQGRSRMTLTYPIINRARKILWLVTGAEKSRPLLRLNQGDVSIPAGRISRHQAVIFADVAATKSYASEAGALLGQTAS